MVGVPVILQPTLGRPVSVVDVDGASTENVAVQGWDDERGNEEVRDEITGSGGSVTLGSVLARE